MRGEAEAATRRLRAAQAAAAEAEDHVQHLQQELSYVKQRFAPAAHLCDRKTPPATPSRASAPAASMSCMSHSGAAGIMWWPHGQGQVTQSLFAGATRACPQLPSWCRAEKAASKGQGLEGADTGKWGIRLKNRLPSTHDLPQGRRGGVGGAGPGGRRGGGSRMRTSG